MAFFAVQTDRYNILELSQRLLVCPHQIWLEYSNGSRKNAMCSRYHSTSCVFEGRGNFPGGPGGTETELTLSVHFFRIFGGYKPLIKFC